MFSAIGTGMASPYLLLAAFPAAGRVLPKPGAWMTTFRVVMGFLLAATLVWLLFVLSGLVPATRVAFFEIALLAIALVVWLGSRSAGRGGRRIATLATAGLAVVGVFTVMQGRGEAGPTTLGVAPEDRLISWQPFDRAQAEQMAAEGRYVFVDVTADWCFTCKVNERSSSRPKRWRRRSSGTGSSPCRPTGRGVTRRSASTWPISDVTGSRST